MKTSVTLAMIFCMGAALCAEQPDSDQARAQRLFRNFDTNGDGGISLEEYRAGMAGNMSATRIGKVFKEKDRDGDGRLSLEELLYIPMDQRSAATPPPPKDNRPSGSSTPSVDLQTSGLSPEMRQRQRLFSNFDRNGDGGISLDEYRAGMAGNMSASRIERVFKEKDRNGDGQLSLEELLYVPADQRPAATPPLAKDIRPSGASAPSAEQQTSGLSAEMRQRQRLFSNFDRNGDGGISLDEYRAGMAGNMSASRIERVFKEKDRNGDGKLTIDELMYVPSDQRQ